MRSRFAFALVVAALAGCDDDSPSKPAPQGPTDAAGTVTALGEIYEARSLAAFTALLSEDFVFLRDFVDPETGAIQWNAAEELAVHARMFEPGSIPASDIPLNADLWLEVMDVTLTPLTAFSERQDLYTASNRQGALDPNHWIARGATYQTSAYFDLRGDTDYQVEGRAYFVILEDRHKQVGEAGKFLLYRWEDRGQIRVAADASAVEPHSWSAVKTIYRRGRAAPPGAAGLIDHLAESYRTRNLRDFSMMLAQDFRFIFDQPNPSTGETDWGADEELEVHYRMLSPNAQPPVPADLVVQDIQITLTPATPFVERRDLYTTASPPGPLNPALWIAREASYGTDAFFQLAGETDYQVTGRADFVVLENRYLHTGHPNKFVLYRWEELGMTAAVHGSVSGVEATSWTGIKSLYRIPVNLPIGDAPGLIEGLATAYREMNLASFEALLSPNFLFILDMPNPDTGETLWDRTTENRIHQRMFDPENAPPGDPPLPSDYWLQSVTISLTPEATFVERQDLYTTSDPPGPLDPSHWKAEAATYGTNVFFQLQGETDYQVSGRAYFTVTTDLSKNIGDPGKFLILRWEDLGTTNSIAIDSATWGSVKDLFR